MNLYVIYDKVAEESGPVFEAKNDAVAARKMRDFAKSNPIDPSEYKLLYVGNINHSLCHINPEPNGSREIEWKVPTLSLVEEK